MSDTGGTDEAGFKDRTPLADARAQFEAVLSRTDRTETLPATEADGRALAERVAAGRNVPHYRRAAMDGYAVRAEDTHGASGRSPERLRVGDEFAPGTAARVHTGSPVPDGADAVVMIEDTERVGDDVEVFEAVAEGENVAPVGEDVAEGDPLYEPGHRLRPSDLGLLKSVGVGEVEVFEKPAVAVVPVGEELVQEAPDRGETIETNGLTVSRMVDRWGGDGDERPVADDDEDAIRAAIERNLDADVVVTSGGSSVGERDLTVDVVDEMGEVLVHGVGISPGYPVALSVVEETPVVVLPGYPVSCIIAAVQFLRPAVKAIGGLPERDHPTMPARLGRKIRSEPGVRTYARVRLTVEDGQRTAIPTRTRGAGVLSSVALADGWIEVGEESEGLPEDEIVAVQDWEWSA